MRDFLASVQSDDDAEAGTLVSFDEEAHAFGVDGIDEDHRQLMDVTNELYRAIKSGTDAQTMTATFQHLKTYTTRHFEEEEAFMARAGYPEYERHARHHAHFMERVNTLFNAYRSGDTSAGMDLLALLGNWWRNHLEGDDAQLARFVRSQATPHRMAS